MQWHGSIVNYTTILLFRTLAIIKPEAITKLGVMLNLLKANDIQPCKAKMVKLERKDAIELYEEHRSKPFFK